MEIISGWSSRYSACIQICQSKWMPHYPTNQNQPTQHRRKPMSIQQVHHIIKKEVGIPPAMPVPNAQAFHTFPRSIVGGFCVRIAPAPNTVSAPTKADHNCLQQPLPKMPANSIQLMPVQMNAPLHNQLGKIYHHLHTPQWPQQWSIQQAHHMFGNSRDITITSNADPVHTSIAYITTVDCWQVLCWSCPCTKTKTKQKESTSLSKMWYVWAKR